MMTDEQLPEGASIAIDVAAYDPTDETITPPDPADNGPAAEPVD